MKILYSASAIAIAIALCAGSASAEEKITVFNGKAATPSVEQFSFMKNIPSAVPMSDEQLDDTFGEGYVCEPTRRRWFDRSGPIGEPR